MNVYVYTIPYRGKSAWCVEYTQLGKRKRKVCHSKAAADGFAKQLRDELGRAAGEWARLDDDQRERIILGVADATRRGYDVQDLLVRAQGLPATTSKALADVIAELIQTKEKAGRASGYTKSLGQVLRQFARGRERLRVDLVTLADVEEFLESKLLASRSTHRARLSTLFKFALRRGYMAENPCTKLEATTYHQPPPRIFTPGELRLLLEWFTVNPKGFTWFVLTTLCGLRPEEAQRTVRKAIQLREGHIVVSAQTTKVRQRRIVTPMPEAMQWLRISLNLGGRIPLHEQSKKRLLKKLRAVLGWKSWPKDVTRHTAASIWLARVRSAAEVAEQLGNSESVLKRNYKALITAKQLESYLYVLNSVKLTPPNEPKTTLDTGIARLAESGG